MSALSVTHRFSLSIDGLWRAVAAMIALGRMQAAMIALIVTRIRRIETRVLKLVAAIRAGRVRGGWVIAARAARAPLATGVKPPLPRVPRSFAWLVVMVPYQAAGFASQLRHLLTDPEMVGLLMATPRLGKILRPLCWMLGIDAELLSPVVTVPVTVVNEDVAKVSAAEAEAGGLGFVTERSVPVVVPEEAPDAGAWFFRLG